VREVRHGEGHRWVTSSVVDLEAIDHERVIGTVGVTGEDVMVRVAQRVDYDLLAEPISCRASALRITVGGMFEMTSGQARELAGFLMEAAEFAESVATTSSSHLFS
jgi:hypothetical protein